MSYENVPIFDRRGYQPKANLVAIGKLHQLGTNLAFRLARRVSLRLSRQKEETPPENAKSDSDISLEFLAELVEWIATNITPETIPDDQDRHLLTERLVGHYNVHLTSLGQRPTTATRP